MVLTVDLYKTVQIHPMCIYNQQYLKLDLLCISWFFRYSQFYKIEKFNKGYLFYIQKYACYLCFNEDFTPEQQQVLEDKLKQYQNYYQK
ncbi:hypothetical protein GA0061081_10781 [Gilliamella bombicola]|uniref:YcxB-like C-terminal domain-containing protein n=1 Tax=Gilliamella bombicola TaxID=1798182 RepID=A0A1C4C8I5_9GAMM|nr:hypothetical protein GA0061081_10781 [Gilliamella bombicola]